MRIHQIYAFLGAMGVVMGHELSHAFDDQGRQYDAQGNMVLNFILQINPFSHSMPFFSAIPPWNTSVIFSSSSSSLLHFLCVPSFVFVLLHPPMFSTVLLLPYSLSSSFALTLFFIFSPFSSYSGQLVAKWNPWRLQEEDRVLQGWVRSPQFYVN